ncbi:MAG: hypothetical protein WBP93_22865 [Pyrinomonadaceae bacterium]
MEGERAGAQWLSLIRVNASDIDCGEQGRLVAFRHGAMHQQAHPQAQSAPTSQTNGTSHAREKLSVVRCPQSVVLSVRGDEWFI